MCEGKIKEPRLVSVGSESIRDAAKDFRYLLDRRYPRKQALELVGNRYQLSADQRHLLHRAVFSREEALLRRKKRISLQKLRDRPLAIDGHNVIITVEAHLEGRPVILGDDGFIRDISGRSRNFRPSKRTTEALRLIMDLLERAKPAKILFLFDGPISRSGELAREARERMEKESLQGEALAVPVPERILLGFHGVVATSDTAIIDRCGEIFDLAGWIIRGERKRGGTASQRGFLPSTQKALTTPER